jgi:beta-lactamase class A/beta-lactamase class A VEB
MIKTVQFAAFVFLLTSCQTSNKKTDLLRNKIEQITSGKDAIVGVSIIADDGKDTISFHGDRQFPLQSVFKYHIALTMLSQIDNGKFLPDQKIEIQKKDLLPGLWSPLREENPDGGSFPISKLMEYAVSLSDNVACDVLLRLLGGPGVVEDYFRKNNINDLSIKLNEEQQQSDWDLQFQNHITPKAANETLAKFYFNAYQLLSPKSHDFIWKAMRETKTGENRIKGLLPEGTVVAHKTGSSGTNKEGLTAAVNDIGIVFLPNGKYFFISVFVTNSKENEETNEKIIADIAKATYDFYANTTN